MKREYQFLLGGVALGIVVALVAWGVICLLKSSGGHSERYHHRSSEDDVMRDGGVLAEVRERGFIRCGVGEGLPGFGYPDASGVYVGFDVDFCHAMAAAVFGDKSKIKPEPISAPQRFAAMQAGRADVLSRNTTWTLTRDTSAELNFALVTFYDGQGFMVPKALGKNSARELGGSSVCVQSGTTTELNLADFFRLNGLDFEPVVFESLDETRATFLAGRCDAYTTDMSGIVATLQTFPNPDDYIVLPETISKEPLGPSVLQGDDEWFDIARWTGFALVAAEELGISSRNVDQMLNSDDPKVKRLLGESGGLGEGMGLDNRWAYNIIKQVGNYGEIFDRHLGPNTPINLSRGLNDLWTRGGLMYSPPFR